MLYDIIISPIETIVDWIFHFILTKIPDIGIMGAVAGVSLAINFLALPLYNIADSLQEKERKIAKSLEYRTKRIKKAFKGDEQFMMLSEYYRQNNYHPIYVLRSSLSILIEIPFFIAAYHYLSHCELLQGASFWIFSNLGTPDALIPLKFKTHTFALNILPIIMTLINFVSGAIYTKEAPLREKIQLYAVASIFLVLLYNSPSGLVLYWILNNIFSLIKNIVMKMKNPSKILHCVISMILWAITAYFLIKRGAFLKKTIITLFTLFITFLPNIHNFIRKFLVRFSYKNDNTAADLFPIFIISCIGTALLTGLVLPASVISTSAIEFSYLGETESPSAYIWHSLWVFTGFFVFWPICIYKMFGKKVRRVMPGLFFVLFICTLANAYIFNYDYGTLTVTFDFETKNMRAFSPFFTLVPILFFILALLIYLYVIIGAHKKYIVSTILCAFCIAECTFGAVRIIRIHSDFSEYRLHKTENALNTQNDHIKPFYNLSKTNKNVIVFFLDKACSSFFPYALEVLPELKEQLKGFIYYPNTLSFSTYTNTGTPAMLGGYEYTPIKINERSSELLKDKHNEATLIMPLLFLENGFEVTVTDPPWPNYSTKGDLSAFKSYPQIKVAELTGNYYSNFKFEHNDILVGKIDKNCSHEIINFSFLQILYPPCRTTFYDHCRYSADYTKTMECFSCLYYLQDLTSFNSDKNTFTFIDNETTHEPILMNTKTFDLPDVSHRKIYNALNYDTNDNNITKHYHVFLASIKQLGLYCDFLRKNNVYDNTRIIIVSDHGVQNNALKDFLYFENPFLPSAFNCLFMSKDFNHNAELKTDTSFMTNADTLFLAKKGLIPNNVKNPFSEKILQQEKTDGCVVWSLMQNNPKTWHANELKNEKQFSISERYAWHVSDNIFDEKNWVPLTTWKNMQKQPEGVE